MMNKKCWFIITAIVSCAVVAGCFLLMFPPVETVSKYDDELGTMRVWRINNWQGTYTEIFPPHYYEQKKEKNTKNTTDPGLFGQVEAPPPGIDISDMNDPFADTQSSGGK